MGVGRRLSAVLLVAGSVLVAAGVAGASTDPEVEREAQDSTSTTTVTTMPSTTSIESTTTTTTPDVPTSDESTTTLPAASTTTAATVPAADAEQVPTFWLRGLCATPNAFIFAMSNLGSEPVEVALVFNGAPFDTVTLAAGEVYGFRTDAPGTMVAELPGASFQTESFDAPCPIAPGSIGMGGLCRDITTGYQWLLGNSGPDPVDVEVQLGGAVVGTFTVESGGFAGFTTPTGGEAQALVGGQVVAEASSSEGACVLEPVTFGGSCFTPGQGYRWFVFSQVQEPLTVEFRLDGVLQVTLPLGAVEGTEVTTAAGGVAELVVDGRVASTATSDNTLCDSPIGLFSQCADAAGAYWFVGNGSATSVQVRLVLDGVEVGVVTVQPGEEQAFTSADAGTMEAFLGTQLVARAESSSDPCVRIVPVCADPTDGQVWGLEPARPVVVTVEIGGVAAGTFDLTVGGRQFTSTLSGTAQVFINGILVDEAEPATGPCVVLFAVCSDSAIGSVFAVSNLRDQPARAEVRMNGATLGVFDLEAFGFVEVASLTAGTAELYLDGLLVMEAESSDEQCLNVDIFTTCFEPAAGGYQWNLQNQRAIALVVELRLDGTPVGTVSLDPFGGQVVSNSRPGTMQVYLNGVFMSEAESSSEPCTDSQPTVAPARLPGTGGAPAAPLVLGLVALIAGLVVLASTRRREDRTPVRG